MTTITETDVVEACRTIFGKHINICRDFLFYLQPSGVKSAYRRRAKENHPDLFTNDPVHVQQKQTALFRDILRAYDTLNLFFKQRDRVPWRWNAPGGSASSRRADEQASTARRASPSARNGDAFYSGMIPNRTLQIGQYLYYRGKISFGAMINALVWQRSQRPSIGDIARQWGWLDAEGLTKIMRVCERPRLFGEKAVELGLLTVFQVNTILLYQRSQQTRLGDYFVQQKIIASDTIERLARDLMEHNAAVLASRTRTRTENKQHAHA